MVRALLLGLPLTVAAFAAVTSVGQLKRMSNRAPNNAADLVAQVTLFSADYKMLYLQDGEAAAFASLDGSVSRPLQLGDWVRVRGTTKRGKFAPLIVAKSVEWQRWSPLPKPVAFPDERLANLTENNVWGTLTARISRVTDISNESVNQPLLLMNLVNRAGLRFRALCVGARPGDVRDLVGAEAEMTGVVAHEANGNGQTEGPLLLLNSRDQVRVLRAGLTDWKAPKVPLDGIRTYGSSVKFGDRVTAQGVVTYRSKSGDSFYLGDEHGGVLVWLSIPAEVGVGQAVEVAGVVDFEEYVFGIGEAQYRIAPHRKVSPLPVAWNTFYHYGGRLIETNVRFRSMERRGQTMVLVADRADDPGHDGATVEWPISPEWSHLRFTPGDLLQVRGVARFRPNWDYPMLAILLRTPSDIWIVNPAPWWRRTPWDIVAAVAGVLLLVTLIVLAMSRRQVSLVLAERARIGRELHDTVLQGFSGLILQLEAMSQRGADPFRAGGAELKTVLSRMEHYLTDARDSISALRRSPTPSVSLPDQLRFMAEGQIEGSEVALEFRCDGTRRPLNRTVEAQLYRIATEAVTNAMRHASPKNLKVILRYKPTSVSLLVADDGRGFDLASAGAREGHFGLQSMQERAAELKGELTIDTAEGKGCLLKLSLPG